MTDIQISSFPLSLPVDTDVIHIKKTTGEDNKATFEALADEILSRVEVDPPYEDLTAKSPLVAGDKVKLEGSGTEDPYKTTLDDLYVYFMKRSMPIGTLYYNRVNATNPSTLLGFGTWVQKRGVFIVGEGSSTDGNGTAVTFTAGATGGEHSHAVTEAELPYHRHSMFYPVDSITDDPLSTADDVVCSEASLGANESYRLVRQTGGGVFPTVGGTSYTGSGTKHNNIPYHIVSYVWERTA